ncbi:pyridoxal phosphate-dependent aminotransferase [Gluconobacter wancherniae]|uniref:pyridoxal phosphate-dependent aminotransferase n=1 Tax=Gluconobacter wancherniae TaxID=1307955 RepID=UPI001B8BD3F4|nr:pyridoxal phosphate-dependent aminotransferase [Gluconobacter wancherniae]MBS1093891.1 pyridoxal phosphate-dependent aminotransferase [Gluconobacter wancherniae]
MTDALSPEARDDLLARGYSRRSFGRIAALLGGGAIANSIIGHANARSLTAMPDVDVTKLVRIGSNECWTGPFPAAAKIGAEVVFHGNRYDPTGHMHSNLLSTVSAVENIPEDHVIAWAGSSDPLMRSVVTFCSPTRGLVTANPSYEAAWGVADWLKVPLTRIPLKAENGYKTDVRAMLKADPNAGVYYVCTPNNPTGTVTPLEDIAWLVENKPKGSIVLVDEAYIHFSNTKSALSLVGQGKEVIVLRTFSKIFGMAGLRLGLSFAHPDVHARMMRYDGENETSMLPMPAVACGTKSLTMAADIAARRSEMIAARTMTFDHLTKRGVSFIPSDANMFVLDWKKPAGPIKDAFLRQNVLIGRSWEIWPNASRITVGSMAEMEAFCAALDHVMA